MKDLHEIFSEFREDYPKVYSDYEALGREIHEKAGPLPDKVRWLIKIAISSASHRLTALETHIMKAREAGIADAEIEHALLMLIQTAGFPTFMEAYSVFKRMKKA